MFSSKAYNISNHRIDWPHIGSGITDKPNCATQTVFHEGHKKTWSQLGRKEILKKGVTKVDSKWGQNIQNTLKILKYYK